MTELQAAAEAASRGTFDLPDRRRACEEMDRIREEVGQKHGELDIGVLAIRELRDA